MNVIAPFLALALCASTVVGQDLTQSTFRPPVLLAQTAAPAAPGDAPAEGSGDSDTFTISPSKSGKARAAGLDAPTTNMWSLVLRGGWAMIPLGFLSVVTVMLVLVYLITLRRSSILTSHYMNTAEVLLRKGDYLGLLAISSRHSETVARIVQRTLDFATKNPSVKFDTIREIAETEGGAQAASLQHRITYLADIGVLAPMIGLLGTVIGITTSFYELGRESTATQSRDNLLASGVSEALIATGGGLILGILAMGCYALFRNRVHALISDMEIATVHILGLLSLQFDKKQERSRAVMEDDF